MTARSMYRTGLCGRLGEGDVGNNVRAAGWVESIRDHGGVLFMDLRDCSGRVQVVLHDDAMLSGVTRESVVSVSGRVSLRDPDTVNEKLSTGTIEIVAESVAVLGRSGHIPFEPNGPAVREELRLAYRFLDLRSDRMQKNLRLRSDVLSYLRHKMESLGFMEVQTPILTASSPEGARDYLVPSRRRPGQFYALPQAPQVFKQLLMASGIDRYYQIAPCFRDEDARADRSPGEFYQLDFEMAFAGSDEVFEVAQEVLCGVFEKFSQKPVAKPPFPRFTYAEAMLKFGSDKPDLRNPLVITDLSHYFKDSAFKPFCNRTVRAIKVPGAAAAPRSFFEGMEEFALSIGMKGLGYFKVGAQSELLGPIAKFLSREEQLAMIAELSLSEGDVLYFIADSRSRAERLAGTIRSELGRRLNLLTDDFRFCFVTDFPMYERDEVTGEISFMHNPFSMPKGGPAALYDTPVLEIVADQYDVVVNGVELSSGAVRNHDREALVRAFSLAGYSEDEVRDKFNALYTAFGCGTPPHAGMAPGIDRMLMLLTGEESIREVIAFPLNQNGDDLMMGAPSPVTPQQLREANIRIRQSI